MTLDQSPEQEQNQSTKPDHSIGEDPLPLPTEWSRRNVTLLNEIGVSLGWDVTLVLFVLASLCAFLVQSKSLDTLSYLALVIVVFSLAQTFVIVRHLFIFTKIDLSAPLVEVQSKLCGLQIARLRFLKWSMRTWMFLWIPLLLILAKAVAQVNVLPLLNAEEFVANLILGLIVIGLAIGVSRNYGNRLEQKGVLRRLVGTLAGRSLSEAIHLSQTLEPFVQAQRPEEEKETPHLG